MNKLLLTGLCAALVLPLAASAGPHRKPGLWETTMTMKFTKGGPQIPPEQLAKMQQMGIKMPFMGGEPQTFKHCLTAEQAAKEDKPDMGGRGDCEMKNANWSGNTFSADMVCHTKEGEMHGHSTGSFTDDSFTGSATMAGTNPHMGGEFAMDEQFTGKWLGADCGGVPPGQVR